MTLRNIWESHRFRLLFVATLVGVPATAGAVGAFFDSGAYLVGFAGLVGSLIAMFRESVRDWIWRPSLIVSYDHDRDYCDTPILHGQSSNQIVQAPAYYFRLLILNNGTRRAEKVEVLATDLLQFQNDSSFIRLHRYSMNLKWANLAAAALEGISPGMQRFCDIGHVVRPDNRQPFFHENLPAANPERTLFSLDTEVQPNHLSHLLEPGRYRLTVVVAASNVPPIRRCIEFELSGEWFDDIDRMLEDGIHLRLMTPQEIAKMEQDA